MDILKWSGLWYYVTMIILLPVICSAIVFPIVKQKLVNKKFTNFQCFKFLLTGCFIIVFILVFPLAMIDFSNKKETVACEKEHKMVVIIKTKKFCVNPEVAEQYNQSLKAILETEK